MNREQIERIESTMAQFPEGSGIVGLGNEKIPAWVFSQEDILTLVRMARTSLQLPQLLNSMEDLKLKNRNIHDELAATRKQLKGAKKFLWFCLDHIGGLFTVSPELARNFKDSAMVSISEDPVSGNVQLRALGGKA